jgi:hypothetical protein
MAPRNIGLGRGLLYWLQKFFAAKEGKSASIRRKWGLILTLVQLATKLDLPQIGAFQSRTNLGASELDLRGSPAAHDLCPIRTYVWIGRRAADSPW